MENVPSDRQSYLPAVDEIFDALSDARKKHSTGLTSREVGRVRYISSGIARVTGLSSAGFDELVRFRSGVEGIVFNVDENALGCVLLGESSEVHSGMEVERTGRVVDVPAGDGLIGRLIDPLGRPLDGKGSIDTYIRLPVEREAPAIMDRQQVMQPLHTGIKVIDALIPVGRGQRELILGDRQTGKTSIAVDTIVNQKDADVLCVYCAIGQRSSSVAKVASELEVRGCMEYTTVMVAEGNMAPGLRYIAPYAAMTIGEHFMGEGRDVLIVFDDLTSHARSYREISLLLRRPPGREAYPGDIFYVHSRLLERATHLSDAKGGGSLTALPIVETEEENISSYIPTNLISITDGQIYLSPELFQKGILPAVDVGKSVSRVGGKAQLAAYRDVAGALKLSYSQFEELESFSKFGTRLDEETRQTLGQGERIRSCLKQSPLKTVPVVEQILLLKSVTSGLFEKISIDDMDSAKLAVRGAVANLPSSIVEKIEGNFRLSPQERDELIRIAGDALEQWSKSSS